MGVLSCCRMATCWAPSWLQPLWTPSSPATSVQGRSAWRPGTGRGWRRPRRRCGPRWLQQGAWLLTDGRAGGMLVQCQVGQMRGMMAVMTHEADVMRLELEAPPPVALSGTPAGAADKATNRPSPAPLPPARPPVSSPAVHGHGRAPVALAGAGLLASVDLSRQLLKTPYSLSSLNAAPQPQPRALPTARKATRSATCARV